MAATDRFEQVSLAARSGLSQVDSAAPLPQSTMMMRADAHDGRPRQPGGGTRAAWDDLFELRASDPAAPAAADDDDADSQLSPAHSRSARGGDGSGELATPL